MGVELGAGLPPRRHQGHLTLLAAQQAPAFLTYLPQLSSASLPLPSPLPPSHFHYCVA